MTVVSDIIIQYSKCLKCDCDSLFSISEADDDIVESDTGSDDRYFLFGISTLILSK